MTTEEEFIKRVGNNIVKARKNKGMKQVDLAYKIGMEPSSLRRIERGRTNTTLKMLFKIANALDTTIENLVRMY